MTATQACGSHIYFSNTNMKETLIQEKKQKNRKKRIILYIILAISFAVLCAISIYYLLQQLKNTPLTLSVLDGQTITLEYGVDTLPEVTATYRDSQFSKEDIYVDVQMIGEVDFSTIGSYEVTYIASIEEETVTATHTYIIQDFTAPTITLIGGDVGYYSPGYSYADPGVTASDNYDGDITEWVIRTETPTAITYSVMDSNGNECSVTRDIICQDIVPPTLTLNGENHIIIKKGQKFVDPGCLAFDDVNGDISASIITTGSINTKAYGKQYLTYSVVDSSGNIAQIQRCVVVQEFTPPELTLLNGNAYVRAGEEFVEPGFTATDNIDGNINDNVIVSGLLDTSQPGIYNLTYTAFDSSMNQTSANRTVYVYEPQSNDLRINPTEKIVYLSFDDGPGQYTELLLDKLDKYNIDVTFFVTNQFPKYQECIGDAYFRGHTIGLHTYSHKFSKVYSNEAAYYDDLYRISDVVESLTGIKPTIIRFPGGTSNTISQRYEKGIMTSLTKSVVENGYHYCDWNVDSKDAGGATTAAQVAQNVIAGIQKHDVSYVLQHDTKLYSIEALDEIICWGMLNGYTFLPMTETTPMHHHAPRN